MTDYFNISLLCVFSFPRCQHITKFLGKAFKPDQRSLNIQPRPRMIASEWVFRYLEIYVLLPCHQKILTLVVCWQGFMWITCLMTWLYANQESDYATHHGRSPRYVLKNWLTSEQRNIITNILVVNVDPINLVSLMSVFDLLFFLAGSFFVALGTGWTSFSQQLCSSE